MVVCFVVVVVSRKEGRFLFWLIVQGHSPSQWGSHSKFQLAGHTLHPSVGKQRAMNMVSASFLLIMESGTPGHGMLPHTFT